MDVLYPTEYIKKQNFSGKLLIDGDLGDNCILFRFMFDTPEMVHPLIIWGRAIPIVLLKSNDQEEKKFVFECNIPDYSNQVMKTGLIFPDFLLNVHKIEVTNVESQISCQFFERLTGLS